MNRCISDPKQIYVVSVVQPLSNNRAFVSSFTQAGELSVFFMIKTSPGLQKTRSDFTPLFDCFNGGKTISFLFLDTLIVATYSSDISLELAGYGRISMRLILYEST